jgi:hypothetical protein
MWIMVALTAAATSGSLWLAAAAQAGITRNGLD